ncbi:outer membrane protein assembly factor BamB family protein [Blastopirellula marina]|uniref:Putative serine/threonine protein kinase related protein n=1 Tax=Blastopirellula marina DSM 3645 TaxID=314230 RepID=A3ZNW0_9BACT|nr:PQQ-binding-like beta-propeller repeat protein [Blastopirellula marina]EAQ82008.1 putative serine/threonine protein kinase related protein [Blastopirellula marina DSM 3645]
MIRTAVFFCGIWLLTAPVALAAQPTDWPQFRGPRQDGDAGSAQLPVEWSEEENIVWRKPMPGFGASSPIVFGDRIYITYYNGYGLSEEEPGEKGDLQRHLMCVNKASGDLIWDEANTENADKAADYRGFIALHGFASSTPVADDTGIYVYYGSGGAAAYSHEGKLLWQKVLGDKTHAFGTANSPVLYEDLVILNGFVECGAIVALDKKTGQERWRFDQVNRAWNTPCLVAVDGQHELVFSSQGTIRALDPATGKELWFCAGIDDYICPSVIAHDGIVYAIGARKSTAVAIKAGGRGDVSETHRLWEQDKGSNVSSPVYFEGHLYWASEGKGIVYCADAKTGEIKYEERLEPRPGRIYASPIVADGKLYYVSRDAGAYVLAASPEFKLLAHNVLSGDDGIFNGSPAVSGGKMYLRSDKFLYCIGN